MPRPLEPVLHDAASEGNLPLLDTVIKEGVDVDHLRGGATALCRACLHGHHECVQRLLDAGADPSLRAFVPAVEISPIPAGLTPLQLAATHDSQDSTACVAALLKAGADPWALFGEEGLTVHHLAAGLASVDAVRLLCEAAPVLELPAPDGQPGAIQQPSCLAANLWGMIPLDVALRKCRMANAHYMVAEVPWGPEHIDTVLAALNMAGARAVPLYTALVARYPLTASQWACVPSRCRGLGAALPTVLWRSEAEAALLVRRMTDTERQHLRDQALCLGVAQRRGSPPSLPGPIVQRLLADCAAHFAALSPKEQAAWRRAWAARQQKGGEAAGAPDAGVLTRAQRLRARQFST